MSKHGDEITWEEAEQLNPQAVKNWEEAYAHACKKEDHLVFRWNNTIIVMNKPTKSYEEMIADQSKKDEA